MPYVPSQSALPVTADGFGSFGVLCENMTSSTKPEVQFREVWTGFEIRERTDRQTNKHTIV